MKNIVELVLWGIFMDDVVPTGTSKIKTSFDVLYVYVYLYCTKYE